MYAKKGVSMKIVAVLLAVVLLVGGAVGGTLAWLMMKTDPIVNTFTTSDVSIKLEETKPEEKTAKMVPGTTIEKDPKVTVLANSEACWLFVKVEAENTADYITYEIAEGWTALDATKHPGVYYREHAATGTTNGTSISILKGDQVSVSPDVTKAMMTTAKTNVPKLTFTAYAVQKENVNTAADAWAVFNP